MTTIEKISLWLGTAYMVATALAITSKALSRLPGRAGDFFGCLYEVLVSVSLDIEKLRGKP